MPVPGLSSFKMKQSKIIIVVFTFMYYGYIYHIFKAIYINFCCGNVLDMQIHPLKGIVNFGCDFIKVDTPFVSINSVSHIHVLHYFKQQICRH